MPDIAATLESLAAMRDRYGAHSPAGHRCSNLILIVKNYERTDDADAKLRLANSLKRQLAELAEAKERLTT